MVGLNSYTCCMYTVGQIGVFDRINLLHKLNMNFFRFSFLNYLYCGGRHCSKDAKLSVEIGGRLNIPFVSLEGVFKQHADVM